MNPIKSLSQPFILYSRSCVLSKPCPIPAVRGVYAWFFKEIPSGVPVDGCIVRDGLTLLYVGISPKNDASSQNLRKRITYHFKGNSGGSTLRLSLGVLLTEKSNYPLRRVGSGKRMTFTHMGEQWLDDWLEENAFVCWIEHQTPWEIERELLSALSLPLNIQDNQHHSFAAELSDMRKAAKRQAREIAIAQEGNQQRSQTNLPLSFSRETG
jgi:hypothetical protein